jgi:hypothetical protein
MESTLPRVDLFINTTDDGAAPEECFNCRGPSSTLFDSSGGIVNEPFHPAVASWFCSTWMALARRPVRWVLQRSLRRIRQDLSLGVGAFAGPTEAGVSAVGVFLGLRLVAVPWTG